MSDQEHPPSTDESSDALVEHLRAHVGEAFLASHAFRGDRTAVVASDALVSACEFLRDDPECAFDMLLDLTVVDYLGRRPRFEVVYHLYSIEKNHRIRLKVPVEQDEAKVPSVVPVWRGANWLEREAWDLYGIDFEGHPDLRRIYLYEEFQGHPLRKDYPKQRRQPLVGPGAPEPTGGGNGEG